MTRSRQAFVITAAFVVSGVGIVAVGRTPVKAEETCSSDSVTCVVRVTTSPSPTTSPSDSASPTESPTPPKSHSPSPSQTHVQPSAVTNTTAAKPTARDEHTVVPAQSPSYEDDALTPLNTDTPSLSPIEVQGPVSFHSTTAPLGIILIELGGVTLLVVGFILFMLRKKPRPIDPNADTVVLRTGRHLAQHRRS